jgi:predicted alpha/beta-hydrolase family hydrolase
VPTLVIQGERDSFGGPDEFPPGPYEMIRVPGADHGLAVPKTAPLSRAAVLDLVVAATGEWVKRVVD